MHGQEPTELAVIPAEAQGVLTKAGLALTNSGEIIAGFAPHFVAFRVAAERAVTVQPDQPEAARLVRLELKNVRTSSERTRKALKEDSLRRGQAIDGLQKVLEHGLIPVEQAMLEIEEAEQRREAKRKADLAADRKDELGRYCDPTHYALGEMSDAAYAQLLAGAKAAKAAAEAEAQAAAARLLAEAEELAAAHARKVAEAEAERVRLAAEAAAARKAADEAAAALAAERAATAQREAAAAESARLEREQAAAIAKAERDRLQAEADAATRLKEAAQRDADRLAAEKAEAARKEALILAAHEEAQRKAAAAPDREKLLDFAAVLAALTLPEMSTADGRRVAWLAKRELAQVAERLQSAAEVL